jgi:hypothetical protein
MPWDIRNHVCVQQGDLILIYDNNFDKLIEYCDLKDFSEIKYKLEKQLK